MWQIQAQLALDLARERAAEARRDALAREGRAMRREEARRHGIVARPGRARIALARVLRGVSDALDRASAAACAAATRVELPSRTVH